MPADPAPPIPASEEDESLGELFWSVARGLRHHTRETVSPFGITPGQARALGELGRHGTMRLSALSERLRIAPRSGTEVVDALEDRGLVRRSPDPEDRRATLVTLTAQGERTTSDVRAAQRAATDTFFGRLGQADRDALAGILDRLRRPDPSP